MAWSSILANKLRTSLSMLGILIGVATVISLVAMGQGSANEVSAQLQGLGTNMLSVNVTGRGSSTTLTLPQAEKLGDGIDGIEGLSPTVSASASARYGSVQTESSVTVEGVTPDYEDVQDFHPQEGRFIAPLDLEAYSKVALLGIDTAEELFGPGVSPIGETILLSGVKVKVVGLLEPKGTSLGASNDEKILLPITTAQRLFQSEGVRTVAVKAASEERMDAVTAALEAKLSDVFRGNTNSYRITNSEELKETATSVSKTMSTMMAGVAAISLLVGGIGIMNIMLVSVTERTREIGIRKALGARKRDVLFQFLVEAASISSLGGALGIAAAFGAAAILQRTGTATQIESDIVLYAFAFSALVGVAFGLFPANKAASLKPVDALRHD
ncbi:FtsX-like permease family protein [Paenibacillus albicereus]|uniref:FtsX-like permease family protein n=2 Tax=Paenibacillus albicereus TaxID=2726185 RepID=A0A6H2H4E3_9BACL|nr:FtsX-like permease family protein [Paenibacillus albicereus]